MYILVAGYASLELSIC